MLSHYGTILGIGCTLLNKLFEANVNLGQPYVPFLVSITRLSSLSFT